MEKRCRKSQISVFVIIGILIIVGVVLWVLVRNQLNKTDIPREVEPVYEYFESCVETRLEQGASLMGSQGGYIEVPEFERGSSYMPFSSELDFHGFSVPYWYYVSGNNIEKTNVPSSALMEEQLEEYLEEEIMDCGFLIYEEQGFEINRGEADVRVDLQEEKISADVVMLLEVGFGDIRGVKENHEIVVDSKLGKFYKTGVEIYNKERKDKFLEKYGLDVLWLYAPMTGVEISCSPKIWNPEEVSGEIVEALEGNIQSIKAKSNDYRLTDKRNNYFVVDVESDENVNFLYSSQWPTRVEIWPVENSVMIAEPVGSQAGMGAMGFCYVPYHFVYDVVFPVLIQIYDEEELFQFPVGVVILKNQLNPGQSEAVIQENSVCDYNLQEVEVYTYDSALNPVEADINFKCFDQSCSIGKTEIYENEARLFSGMPQCVNGFIIAESEGYAEEKYQISTNRESVARIILDREYSLDFELRVDGKQTDELGIIYFTGDNGGVVSWPEQRQVNLSEGYYNVSVYVYENSSIIIPEEKTTKCVDVPKSGLSGIFGGKQEQCFEMTIPEQRAQFAISAGGKTEEYIIEGQFESRKLILDVPSIKTPSTLSELQESHIKAESNKIELTFENE
jgi:hypothetical protein